VVWQGASLWMLEAAQRTAGVLPHAHHAIQLTFCLEGEFEIGVAGKRLTGPVCGVASDVRHSFHASGAVAFLFIAPESAVGQALDRILFADRPWAEIGSGPLESALHDLRKAHHANRRKADVLRIGHAIMDSLASGRTPTMPDKRVLSMIDYARQNLDHTLSLAKAARHINLSDSRARHLFSAQTGLPFKTFMLWLRLGRAVELYAMGHSLTDAAHTAGFADSAHLSRTFKRTFGLPAASLRLLHD
jgi:AraC family transcriptional regulator